jgi:hypothetical protein
VSFRAESRNLLEQARCLLGGFSTLLEATCSENFEIAFMVRRVAVQ